METVPPLITDSSDNERRPADNNISASRPEAAPRENPQRYRALLEALPAAVYATDARGIITFYNRAAADLWGREPKIGVDEWCGSFKIYRPDGSPLPLDQCPTAVTLKEGRAIRGEEIVIERPDGSRRHVLANPQPIFDDSNSMTGATNTLIDITELHEAQRALRQSEERFARFMRHFPGAAWIKDIEGRYVYANESALKNLRTTIEDLGKKTDKELLPPSTFAQFRENDRLALLSETGVQRMVEVRLEDGVTQHMLVHKFPIPGSGSNPTLIGGIAIDITEHKRAEDVLRQTEQRFRLATQTGRVGVWDWNIAGNRVHWTDSLYAIHGVKPGQFDGTVEAFTALVHPQDRERVALAINRALQEDAPYDLEFRLIRPDGETIWIYTSATIIREQDRPVRMIGATVDITDRKRAEGALRRRGERIQLLSDTLAELLRADDPDRIIGDLFMKVAAHIGADSYFNFLVNAQGDALELHSYAGIPASEVTACARLNFGEAVCGTVALTRQAITVNDIQNSDDDKTALGRSLGIQTHACHPLMVGNSLFGTLSFASHTRNSFDDDELEFLRIVSQYAAIAMERLRIAKALRESEARLALELGAMQELHQMTTHLLSMREISSAAAEVLDAAMRIQGADFGKLQVYNPALQILEIVAQKGFPQESLDYFRAVNRDHDSASGIALKLMRRVIIEDVERDLVHSVNRRIAALVGYRSATATPLISRGGALLGMLSIHFRHPRHPTERELRILDLYARQAADFIEVLNVEQEMRQSQEQLRRQALELEEQLIASGRLVSLGEVTASMAHEFNNPLGIILGFAQDLLSGTDPSDPDFRALQIIDEEARRCRLIVQGLMDLSRPRATELIPTRIEEVITRTVSLFESRLYKQKITLETALTPDLPKIFADHQQLQQVLVNVLLNAIDAMPAGGKVSVTAKIEPNGREPAMVIAVADTGVGIDKEFLSKIFLPFFTAGKKRGLGLGLSICERIMKNHGGSIEVASRPGKGTTVKIYLPVRIEHAPAPQRANSTQQEAQ